MVFAKRQLTWGEEVFAGLIILVLIVGGIVIWLVVHIKNAPVQDITTQQPPAQPQPLTKEEKLEIINKSSADSQSTFTEEQKLDALNSQPKSEHTLTYEERLKALEQSQE